MPEKHSVPGLRTDLSHMITSAEHDNHYQEDSLHSSESDDNYNDAGSVPDLDALNLRY